LASRDWDRFLLLLSVENNSWRIPADPADNFEDTARVTATIAKPQL
jgi:hypothetical protein